MPTQPSLPLEADHEAAYKRFETPEKYPFGAFTPKHPKFNRRGEVLTGTSSKTTTYVDLRIGECECGDGFAFKWDQKRQTFYQNRYCIHKLRMIASIVTANDDPDIQEDLDRAYLSAVSSRYNQWVAVSAFHKELRRGDFSQAWFFGLIVATKRGIRGVMHYLLNIVYEETRDHELAEYLVRARSCQRYHNLREMARAIAWFCRSKKKWELPARFHIFEAEMRGYMRLVRKYGREVAGHGNIIPAKDKAKLYKAMKTGFEERDLATFQYGLKGLQKLVFIEQDEKSSTKKDRALSDHRYEIYDWLYNQADENFAADHPVWTVIAAVNARIQADLGIGYHELNAIGDALTGEPLHGAMPPQRKKNVLRRPLPPIPYGYWPPAPLYAHDNHSWKGKALMRRHPEQLEHMAEQTDLDFRWCGAYFGVGYRMVAFREHGDISEWHKVRWPKELFKAVSTLWY